MNKVLKELNELNVNAVSISLIMQMTCDKKPGWATPGSPRHVSKDNAVMQATKQHEAFASAPKD